MQSRAQSQIITTVLIVLLVLAAIVIVWNVVQGTVGHSVSQIEKSTDCIEAIGVLEVEESGSCFQAPNQLKVMINRNLKAIDIIKFIILVNEGEERYEIVDGKNGFTEGIFMFGAVPILQVPSSGESRSYEITTSLSDSIQVAPIINEETCSPSKKVEIDAC